MAEFFQNIFIIFENALITVWYWCNMYRWELLFLIGMLVACVCEYRESKTFYIDDERKVV